MVVHLLLVAFLRGPLLTPTGGQYAPRVTAARVSLGTGEPGVHEISLSPWSDRVSAPAGNRTTQVPESPSDDCLVNWLSLPQPDYPGLFLLSLSCYRLPLLRLGTARS